MFSDYVKEMYQIMSGHKNMAFLMTYYTQFSVTVPTVESESCTAKVEESYNGFSPHYTFCTNFLLFYTFLLLLMHGKIVQHRGHTDEGKYL